jgi:RNA polymerase sigma-70 factor (ECF subfamily)
LEQKPEAAHIQGGQAIGKGGGKEWKWLVMGTSGLEFADVYNRFHEKLNRYLERMVGKNDAEDLTQEVFLKINRGLPDFQGKSSLSTWVYRIATNAALDRMKSRSSRDGTETVALQERSQEPEDRCVQEASLSAEREAIRKEMTECIQEFVGKLPTDYRVVLLLSEMKELRNQQIAAILGISVDAVKIRLHRARVRLKAEFAAGCDFYHDEDGTLACDRKKGKLKEVG